MKCENCGSPIPTPEVVTRQMHQYTMWQLEYAERELNKSRLDIAKLHAVLKDSPACNVGNNGYVTVYGVDWSVWANSRHLALENLHTKVLSPDECDLTREKLEFLHQISAMPETVHTLGTSEMKFRMPGTKEILGESTDRLQVPHITPDAQKNEQ